MVSSALAWEAVPSTSLLTCKSYGNSCASVLSLCTLSLSLPLSFLSDVTVHTVYRGRSAQATATAAERERERCKEPRGAPMAPHSHLLSPSPSTISHTPTPIPFLCLSPCPFASPHAGPQSTRTRQSGGRRCPATTSQLRRWTCVHGTRRMKVKSLCRKTGRWLTQKLAWSISLSK